MSEARRKRGEVMTKKLKLAIIDKDLRARTVGKYPVSDNGEQIRVKSGGENHFMPKFDNESFIEFPRRHFPFLWRTVWDRVYFVRKGASACINFKAEPAKVEGPDPELVLNAAGTKMLQNLGKEKAESPTVIQWITLALLILISMSLLGVI